MEIHMPYDFVSNNYANCRVLKTYKSLEDALALVNKAIQDERQDELFYDYLISIAPTENEKQIISEIRDDEKKHNKMFRAIYKFYTKEDVSSACDITFEKSSSYIEGIQKAFFGELAAMERYRDIRAGLPDRYHRDMVFEILTDELEHANKYNYILSKNISKESFNRVPAAKKSFTTEEALQIAKSLNIDFSKELFDVEQFRAGLDVELEHGRRDPATNVTSDNPILTGKIALAHLREFPDYYTRLAKLEKEAKAYWKTKK